MCSVVEVRPFGPGRMVEPSWSEQFLASSGVVTIDDPGPAWGTVAWLAAEMTRLVVDNRGHVPVVVPDGPHVRVIGRVLNTDHGGWDGYCILMPEGIEGADVMKEVTDGVG